MFATSSGVGQGVFTSGFERMGDIFIDARLRTETSGAAYLQQIATSYTQLEDAVGEPGDTGLAAQLSNMWTAWSEASKSTEGTASRSVLLERSTAVVQQIATLYNGAQTQWNQTLTTTNSLVTQVNTTAANLADLNTRILAITNAGGSANELMDARDQLITQLSGLVGASARIQENGTVDVMVGGNALVNGSKVNTLEVTGARPSTRRWPGARSTSSGPRTAPVPGWTAAGSPGC